jgi:hypothetical protein
MKTFLGVICGALVGSVAIGVLTFFCVALSAGPNADGLTVSAYRMAAGVLGLYAAAIGSAIGGIVGGIYGSRRRTPAQITTNHKA